ARAADGNNFGTVLIPEGLIEFIPSIERLIGELNDVLSSKKYTDAQPSDRIDWLLQNLSDENVATLGSLPRSFAEQLTGERDPHGNVQVSLIETEKLLSSMVGQKLQAMKVAGKYKGKFAAQHHFFGYEGRCAAPSNFDADYCYSLGVSASQLIANGKTGYMAIVKNTTKPAAEWVAGGVPITMMLNMEKRKGVMKPVIKKALVDLNGKPFKTFAAHRDEWKKNTCFVYPGPIQYFGPSEVADRTTVTLQLEHI
ncbi:MAG: diphosphate--fructose-6-phosphate 1-phosphotransferase, partial [Bacteroidaceae bacterium]|nr:diphosphate--fructose-6-phosphate 1-phosphotransferase [Bacteroidaceae bacterium]